MMNKVEICGVNTSRLKVLSESEKHELLEIIRSGTDEEREQAREAMINGNLKLVLSVIQRFTNRGENLDDLFQVGCIGLMKAIDHFNPDLQVKFSTYGVPMIIGEIRRYLRDNNSIRVSRSLRDTAYKAMQAKERLLARDDREPTVEQIAQELGLPREDVVLALESIVEPVSLYEPVFSEGGDPIYVMDQVKDNGSDGDWLEEIAPAAGDQRSERPGKKDPDHAVLPGKTQMEVAAEIHISQAQVSRLEKGALEKIKREL